MPSVAECIPFRGEINRETQCESVEARCHLLEEISVALLVSHDAMSPLNAVAWSKAACRGDSQCGRERADKQVGVPGARQ